MNIKQRISATLNRATQDYDGRDELLRDALERIVALEDALGRIRKWHGEFPVTERFWDEPKNTEPMSYGACYGSNGERDFMRNVAAEALGDML